MLPAAAALTASDHTPPAESLAASVTASQSLRWRVGQTAAIAVTCYGAARLGLALQLPGTYAPAVWPASGLGVAALLLLGGHVWPGIAIAAFLANLSGLPSAPAGIAAAAAIAGVSTLEQLGTVAIVRSLCRADDPFQRARHAVCFLAATIGCCLLGAVAATTVLAASGIITPEAVRTTWTTRLVGDAAGIILLAPVLYGWARPSGRGLTALRRLELAALLAVTVLCAEIIFNGWVSRQTATVRPFLPLLLWAAFRFGPRETSLLAVLVSVAGVTHTWNAVSLPAPEEVLSSAIAGFFLNVPPDAWLRVLQLFLGMVGSVSLVVAAAVAERNQSQLTLRDNERRLEQRVLERTGQLECANRELMAQVGERARAERELRDSLREKDTLLREIHHRVKNNLAVICSLLYFETLQATDDRTRSALEQAERRVRSMAMVHEKLYRSGNLDAVDAPEYLGGLLDYLISGSAFTADRVRVSTRIDDARLDADTAIPCGLIVTELVTNCLKHAFPDGRTGTIVVDLRTDANGDRELTVADDGVGMSTDVDVETSSSLGWRLVQSLATQIDGRFTINRTAPGTRAVLHF